MCSKAAYYNDLMGNVHDFPGQLAALRRSVGDSPEFNDTTTAVETLIAVKAPKTDGFGQVLLSHLISAFQIGDGACHFDDAVIGPGR